MSEDNGEVDLFGFQNVTGAPLKVQFNGKISLWEKDEIRPVRALYGEFLSTRGKYISDGTKTKYVSLFKRVSLEEALKFVKKPTDKAIADAKKAQEQKAKDRADLLADLKKELVESGWEPPKAKAK